MRVVYVAIFTSGMLCQKQISSTGTGNYILQYLWDVITCSCPWNLPLISRMFTAFSPSSHQEELILTIATRATVKPSCLKIHYIPRNMHTVFALLCFVVVIHWLIFPYPSGLLHWHDCPSASKATLINMDKYFMWIHYERLHNHNKAKHNKTVCIFLGIYCNLTTAVTREQ